MRPQKKSICDFFSPAPRNPPSAVSSQTTLPQRNANNAPTRPSGGVQDATSHAVSTPLSSSNPSVSSAPPIVRAASADAPPFIPSQTSANSGASKRTTFNGQDVVPNSDSDDDSLPDLDFGISAPKVKAVTTTTSTTRSKRMSEDQQNGLRKPIKKAKADKTSFDALVKTAQQNLETERQIQEHKAALERSLEEPVNTTIAINEDVLGQVVDDDDDDSGKAHRLFQAMQRTNATQMETTYHFFQDTSDSIQVQPRFPMSCLPDHRWVSNFKDPYARDQAFMTGFAHQIFRIQELPQELASWMIDQISSSRNEALSCKYIDILESDRHNKHLRTLLDSQRLDALFRAMGASITPLQAQTELVPVSMPRSETKASLPPHLISIIRLLERVAPWLRSNAKRRALYILCHVCLDDRVVIDADILRHVQDAMEAIICNIDNHKLASALSDVVSQLLVEVRHPLLQRNLVCSLPATSPLTAYLQRHLALAFLVYPTLVNNVPLADPKVPDIIHQHIENASGFRINKDTDYDHLAARLALLDVTIGPGPLDVPYQPLTSPATSEAGSSPVRAPVPASSEVKVFNNEVDALARQFQLLGNSIVEAGAAVDLSIMDAKDSIERLRARLEHAVRIGGKKVHNVFGDEEQGTQPRVDKFFDKTSRKPMGKSIFDAEDDA